MSISARFLLPSGTRLLVFGRLSATLRNAAKIAGERGVSAILVSGDPFDSDTVGKLLNDIQTIIRESGLKFYILPGAGERGISGHDALEPGSVYYHDSWSSVPNAFIFRKEGGEVFL